MMFAMFCLLNGGLGLSKTSIKSWSLVMVTGSLNVCQCYVCNGMVFKKVSTDRGSVSRSRICIVLFLCSLQPIIM